MMEPAAILAAIFFIAFLYASVGHGGASGYLAVMALLSYPREVTRPSALLLNIVVAGVAWLGYARGGYFSWRRAWPLIAASVPAAFLGGTLRLPLPLYNLLLAVGLLLAAFRILAAGHWNQAQRREPSLAASLPVGGIIGLVSGAIGIGGGVFLSPLMLFAGWGGLKEVAATSAFFILVNSLSGLLGWASAGFWSSDAMPWPWVASAFFGGVLGAHQGVWRWSNRRLAHVLAVVLIFASFKLLGLGTAP